MTATITDIAAARAARGLPPTALAPTFRAPRPGVGDRALVLPRPQDADQTPVIGTVEAILPTPPGAPGTGAVYHVRTAFHRTVVLAGRVAWPWEG